VKYSARDDVGIQGQTEKPVTFWYIAMRIYNDALQGCCSLGNVLFFPRENVILINNHEEDGRQ